MLNVLINNINPFIVFGWNPKVIQMKATEQYFLVVLFIVLSVNEIKTMTIHMKNTEQYFSA